MHLATGEERAGLFYWAHSMESLTDQVRQSIESYIGDASAYRSQLERVRQVEAELAVARQKLEHAARPLRRIHELLVALQDRGLPPAAIRNNRRRQRAAVPPLPAPLDFLAPAYLAGVAGLSADMAALAEASDARGLTTSERRKLDRAIRAAAVRVREARRAVELPADRPAAAVTPAFVSRPSPRSGHRGRGGVDYWVEQRVVRLRQLEPPTSIGEIARQLDLRRETVARIVRHGPSKKYVRCPLCGAMVLAARPCARCSLRPDDGHWRGNGKSAA